MTTSNTSFKPLTHFRAQQVENGWVVDTSEFHHPGNMPTQYVFRTLGELAEWLKVQVVRDTAKAE